MNKDTLIKALKSKENRKCYLTSIRNFRTVYNDGKSFSIRMKVTFEDEDYNILLSYMGDDSFGSDLEITANRRKEGRVVDELWEYFRSIINKELIREVEESVEKHRCRRKYEKRRHSKNLSK